MNFFFQSCKFTQISRITISYAKIKCKAVILWLPNDKIRLSKSMFYGSPICKKNVPEI